MAKVESQLKQVGSNLRNTGRTLSAAITLPILGIGGAAIKAASDVEEMQAKFSTVFKTVGGEVSRELGNFSKQVNRSRFDLQGMAATFGDIIKPMGFTEQSAAEMSLTLTKLAVDLGSFNNMPMDEALARLRGTLVGSHENALAFGVIINENTLKQELMRIGADKLTGSQKEQAKAQARMNLLLAGTTDAQGDATRTAGSFANQMRGLRNSVHDLGVQIGELLLPHASLLVQRFDRMVDIVSNLSPSAQRLGIAIAGIAAAAGPLVFTLGGMASGFAGIMRAVTITMGMFNPYVAGIAAVAAILIGLHRNADAVKSSLMNLYSEIKERTAPVITLMKNAVITLFKKVGEWVESVVDIGAAIFGTIATWWDDNGTALIERLVSIFEAIGSFFSSAMELIGLIISKVLDGIKFVWARWGDDIVSTAGFIIKALLTILEVGFQNLDLLVKAMISFLKGDLVSAGGFIKSGLQNSLAGIDTIIADFRDAFLDEATTSADDFVEKFDIQGFESIIKYALESSTTDIEEFRKGVLGVGGFLVGEEKLDEMFGSQEFASIIQDALDSSETTISGFKTESLLQIRAGGEELDKNFGAGEFETMLGTIMANAPDLVKDFKDDALGFLGQFKTGAKENLVEDEDSVVNTMAKVKAMGMEVSELDLTLPFKAAPSVISDFALNLQNLQGNLDLVGEEADELARKFDTVFKAIDRLGIDDKSKVYRAFSWLSVASADLTLFTDGFNNLIDLFKPSTYKDFFEGLKGGFRSLRNLSMDLGDKIFSIFSDKKNGFSDFVGKLGDSDGLVGKIAGSLGTWLPGIGAAGLALKAFGIDAGDVLKGVKNVIKGIGDGIKNIFGRASKEKKKAARLDRFVSDVSALGVDLSNLSASDKKSIQALMTPLLTSGIATSDDLLAVLGLDSSDLMRTVTDAFQGIQSLASVMDVPDAGSGFNSAIFGLLNNFAEDIAAEFGMTQLQAEMEMFEFFGVSDRIQEIRDEVARMRANQLGRGVDPDGETGVGGFGDPDRPGSAVDVFGNLVGDLAGGAPNFAGINMFGSDTLATLGAYGAAGMGASMGGSDTQQTINVNLDGQTIATATMPYWSQELEIYGTNR
jgi:phage-related protein